MIFHEKKKFKDFAEFLKGVLIGLINKNPFKSTELSVNLSDNIFYNRE